MPIYENPAMPGGASRSHDQHGDTERYHNTPFHTLAQSPNTAIFRAIEALAALPGTADIRHGLAALLVRHGGGNE